MVMYGNALQVQMQASYAFSAKFVEIVAELLP